MLPRGVGGPATLALSTARVFSAFASALGVSFGQGRLGDTASCRLGCTDEDEDEVTRQSSRSPRNHGVSFRRHDARACGTAIAAALFCSGKTLALRPPAGAGFASTRPCTAEVIGRGKGRLGGIAASPRGLGGAFAGPSASFGIGTPGGLCWVAHAPFL